MKTTFELDVLESPFNINSGTVKIIGTRSEKYEPYIKIEVSSPTVGGDKRTSACIKDVDMERFAVNILKALKSKKLNTKQKTK